MTRFVVDTAVPLGPTSWNLAQAKAGVIIKRDKRGSGSHVTPLVHHGYY